jgi:CRISPR-associated protein Cmr1
VSTKEKEADMLRQTFKVELVTPCFLGGAKGQAEWRGASIRGQLRWWFRAVAGAHFGQDLEKVRAAEEEIFGSTRRCSSLRLLPGRGPEAEKPDGTGVPFGESLTAEEIAQRWKNKNDATLNRLRLQNRFSDPLHYLAYGPVTRGRLDRPFLPASTSVSFDLQWVRTPADDLSQLFTSALWAWLYLGGIGARSRKGFGSLHLQRIASDKPAWKTPMDQDAFRNEAGRLLALGRRVDGEPAWTCFSQGSRIFVGSDGFDTADEALSRLGGWLIAFRRRYGKATDTRSLDKLPVAGRDYEWAAPNGTKLRQGIPDRIGFGLPLPFTRRVDGQFLGESVIWGPDEKDPRRASPLLLHVARFGKSYFPVLTYLPAQFLPHDAKLGFKDHPFPAEGQVEPPRPGIVSHFLDDLARKKLVTEIGASS